MKTTSKKAINSKQKAQDSFIYNLLESEIISNIGKIYLFGSMVDGNVSKFSDVDILIFALDNIKKVEGICDDIAFETTVKFGESVEPLIYCYDELHYLESSNFLYSAIGRGKEVYSMKKEDIAGKEMENYLALSEIYFEQSNQAFKIGNYRLAVDGIYNACELCIKGLLTKEMTLLPKTHGGIVQKFGELFIKSEKLPKEMGRNINLALRIRNKARYDFHARIDREDVEKIIKLASDMIAYLSKIKYQQ